MHYARGLVYLCALELLCSSHAIASPNTIELGISCPNASGSGYGSLSNFGGRIAGYGKESINSVAGAHSPYFNYNYNSGHFPTNLADGAYTNNGVEYNATNGTVICKFTSSNGFDPINVSYQMTNSVGGVVISQAQDEIVLLQYLGLRAANSKATS